MSAIRNFPRMIAANRPSIDIETACSAVRSVLESGWITQGPQAEQAERWFSGREYGYAVAVSSGQNALELALESVRRPERSPHVFLPANAFVGDLMALLRMGYQPVFVNVTDTLQLDVEHLRHMLDTRLWRPQGVLAVHIGGWMADMPALVDLCTEYDMWLVEDACQAIGSQAKDSMGNWMPAGQWGIAAAFSFYATKIVTCGEGGMLTTSSLAIDEAARALRNNGASSMWRENGAMRIAGDCRMSDVLAAVLNVELNALDARIEARDWRAQELNAILPPALRPFSDENVAPNWYKYIVHVDDFAAFSAHLLENDIEPSSRLYETPVYDHPAFAECDFPPFEYDTAVRARCANHAVIPIHEALTEDEWRHIKAVVASYAA